MFLLLDEGLTQEKYSKEHFKSKRLRLKTGLRGPFKRKEAECCGQQETSTPPAVSRHISL
jgi:hypothetical protein